MTDFSRAFRVKHGLVASTATVDVLVLAGTAFTNTNDFIGPTGPSGPSGPQGSPGTSSSIFEYKAKTNSQSGDPGNGYIIWDNATQTSATNLHISHLDTVNQDIDYLLGLYKLGDELRIQDKTNSGNYQNWEINGAPTPQTNYWIFPVTLTTSTHSFSNNDNIALIVRLEGQQGATGPSGPQGVQGTQGIQGITGSTGPEGIQGPQGAQGTTGTQGTTGSQGLQGVTGEAGLQGTVGFQGTQGVTGETGLQGTQGAQGVQGLQGIQGLSAETVVSETSPSTPQVGDLWYNSSLGRMFVYYDSYWVDSNPGIIGPSGPTGPAYTKTFVTTSSNTTLGADNSLVIITGSSPVTLTLPQATGNGLINIEIKTRSTSTVTVVTQNSETIDGDPSFIMEQTDSSVTMRSNNLNWFVF